MSIAENGETIEAYPNDKPYPSFLRLGQSSGAKAYPIHIVASMDEDNRIYIITAYKPSQFKWSSDYKTRKK